MGFLNTCGFGCLYGQRNLTLHSLLLAMLPQQAEPLQRPYIFPDYNSLSKSALILNTLLVALVNRLGFKLSKVT